MTEEAGPAQPGPPFPRAGPENFCEKLKKVLDISGKRVIIKKLRKGAHESVGVDWPEGPPVPIPNTEVKLRFVDDSMRATACENR